MHRVFIAPRRYVQGLNVTREAGTWIKPIGEKVAVLAVPMGGKMIANSCNEL